MVINRARQISHCKHTPIDLVPAANPFTNDVDLTRTQLCSVEPDT